MHTSLGFTSAFPPSTSDNLHDPIAHPLCTSSSSSNITLILSHTQVLKKRNLSTLNECAKILLHTWLFSFFFPQRECFPSPSHVLLNPFNPLPFQPPLFTFDMPPNKARPLIKTYCSLHIKDSMGKNSEENY